jgi:glycosyltransferase involved in cell wall biosynthesis
VVFPTANRLPHLKKCVESVRAHLGGLSYEFVIVDGGSTDGTAEWLAEQEDVRLIQHGELRGCNTAFRDGLLDAQGDYVCQLSDDIEVIDGCIPAGVELLKSDPMIGQAAFYYLNPGAHRPVQGYTTMQGGRVLFCAFGITRKEVGDLVDWWSPEYFQQYGDPDLSCKVWQAGYKVAALVGYHVIHHFAERPAELSKHYREDSARYSHKWSGVDG